jgi:hypothetical protein
MIWNLIPDFKSIEYNTYTRLAYSINSNTGKICVPLDEDSYKTWYTDLITAYQLIEDRSLLKAYVS